MSKPKFNVGELLYRSKLRTAYKKATYKELCIAKEELEKELLKRNGHNTK